MSRQDGANLNRRAVMAAAAAGAAAAVTGHVLAATPMPAMPATTVQLPPSFMWGVSTAGHQIEGNNVNSDIWVMENVKPTIFKERSGDADDSYNRYEEDIDLLKSFGFNSYRFSLEWSRIEPDEGFFSQAEIDHYKRVIAYCNNVGVWPCVTFNHYSAPAWFAASGGFLQPDGPDLFARYCHAAALQLADGMHLAFTLNEPQALRILKVVPQFAAFMAPIGTMTAAAAKARGSTQFAAYLTGGAEAMLEPSIAAHKKAYAAIKSVRGDLPTGVCLALMDYQPVGANSKAAEVADYVDGAWFEAAKTGDFVGVQNYMTMWFDSKGITSPPEKPGTPPGPALNPPSLGNAVRRAWRATGKPVIVTENGFDTHDDAARIQYIADALPYLGRAIKDGVPVQGYFHWSLLDNFEWFLGYGEAYGLVTVDRTTFKRTPKPSAAYLGAIARRNRL